MDEDLLGWDEDRVVVATHFLPFEAPAPTSRFSEASRALALAVVAFLCCGFILGPLALELGHRARMAELGSPHSRDASFARAAISIGKAGFALHLMIALTVLPWLLFMLPLLHDG